LISSAAAGDEVAFRSIVDANHDDMVRVCTYVTRNEGLAEDAVQIAWSIAWRKLGSVREPERIRAWLTRIAVNESKKLLKKQRRRSEVEVVSDVSARAGGIDPATGVEGLDLRAALDRLDPDERALLAMRYIAGFDATELSEATGISPGGTRTRLKRLLDRLRLELTDA
jgi:RNA polymerase sigma-70 factor (ECF subfamily)